MIADSTYIPLQDHEEDIISKPYQWHLMKDARFGWRGDILLRCGSKEEVTKLFVMIEGKAVDVAGGGKISIEVIPHISIVEQARDAKRA